MVETVEPETATARAGLAAAAVALLDDAIAAGLGSEDILARLRDLEAVYPGAKLHLVTHEEAYDGSLSYDVLVRGTGRAVSVGVAGSPTLPWPMRATMRPRDQHVLRVNGQLIWLQRVISLLDEVFDDLRLARHLVYKALVDQALDDDPIALTDAEVQRAADAYRRANGLFTAEQTRDWLARRLLSEEKFAELVERTARLAALRTRIAAPGVAAAFAADPARYVTLTVAWVAVPADVDPARVEQELLANPLATVLAAHVGGRAAGVDRRRVRDLPAGALALATVPVDQPVPVRLDGRPVVAVVLGRVAPHLDEATRELVEQELFDAWLEERRQTADVEWYWGQAGQAGLAR